MYSVNYDKLCTAVLTIDNAIRFATVYTKNGDIIGGGMNQDKESLLIPEEVTLSLYYSKHMYEIHKNLFHVIGKEKYSMSEYARVKMISVPLQDDNLLLISIEPKSDHFKMIDHVLTLVENHSKEN